MLALVIERIMDGFSAFDWWMLIAFSIIAALVIRRWDQLTPAAMSAYVVDALAPFFVRLSEGIPANFAFQFAFTRLDDHGAASVLRLGLYFAIIATLFFMRRRYGPVGQPQGQKKQG